MVVVVVVTLTDHDDDDGIEFCGKKNDMDDDMSLATSGIWSCVV